MQLWGERYDADGDEIFSIQDDIIERIVGRLVTRLEDAGISRAAKNQLQVLPPMNSCCAASPCCAATIKPISGKAMICAWPQLPRIPAYGLAHAYLAFADVMIAGFGRASQKDLADALIVAARAVALAPEQSTAHRVLSFVQMYQREYPVAEHHLRRANELNPYDAESAEQMGYLLTLRGRPLEALAWMDRAIQALSDTSAMVRA